MESHGTRLIGFVCQFRDHVIIRDGRLKRSPTRQQVAFNGVPVFERSWTLYKTFLIFHVYLLPLFLRVLLSESTGARATIPQCSMLMMIYEHFKIVKDYQCIKPSCFHEHTQKWTHLVAVESVIFGQEGGGMLHQVHKVAWQERT